MAGHRGSGHTDGDCSLPEAALARPAFLEMTLKVDPSIPPVEPLLQAALDSRGVAR